METTNTTNGDTMNTNEMHKITDARRERMMRELTSNLRDMVEAGDITATQANEWASMKADQWATA